MQHIHTLLITLALDGTIALQQVQNHLKVEGNATDVKYGMNLHSTK